MTDEETRPSAERAGPEATSAKRRNASISPDTDAVPQQFRRRREAAKRLPPLDHLRLSDPWDLETSYDPARGGDTLPSAASSSENRNALLFSSAGPLRCLACLNDVSALSVIWKFLTCRSLMTPAISEEFRRLAQHLQDVA